ncbi:MAG: CRTAC1 family protein [Myxococcales bacterium]
MIHASLRASLVCLVLAWSGCAAPPPGHPPTVTDGGVDGGNPDGGVDGGEPGPDAGLDGGLDAGFDAGPFAPGTVLDAGLYTVTVLAPASPGSCDVHDQQPVQFTDATAQWGLSGVAMTGVVAADLDHDGYPDLIVFSGAQDQREEIPTFWDGGFHNLPDGGFNWDVGVLMNRPNAAGGRTFVDETAQSGLFQLRGGSTTEYRMAQLAAVADVNGDGNPDVYTGIVVDPNADPTASFNQDHDEIMINDGRGHFDFAAQSNDLASTSVAMEPENYQAVFTDVDDDGIVDLFLTYWYANPGYTYFGSQAQLLHGNGDGTFQAVTGAAGLETTDTDSIASLLAGTNPRPSFGATACDLNGDGYPDLLVSSYGGESNLMYLNDGSGHFQRWFQDGGFDGDTDRDYHDNQYFVCYCTVHAQDPDCAGVGSPQILCPSPADAYWDPQVSGAPAMLNGNNFSAACRDMNGDGKADIFQGTIRHWWAGQSTDPSTLLLNQTPPGGNVDMQRVPGETDGVVYPHLDPQGWNEGIQQTALVDMDNDGRPDILNGGSDYAYQYGHLFIQQPDGTFQDEAKADGLLFPCMDGIWVADYDRDGDLDVVVRGSLFRNCAAANGGWPALPGSDPGFAGYAVPEVHIFTSNASEHSHWLELRLRGDGTTANTLGLGARVTVTVNGVAQVQEAIGSHGIGTEVDDPGVLFFGLGACAAVDEIDVQWPSKSHAVDRWTQVPGNHFLELRQGDPHVYGINLR